MVKIVVCQLCGLECDGIEAGNHKGATGHNDWGLILPEDKNQTNSLGVENHQGVALDNEDGEMVK